MSSLILVPPPEPELDAAFVHAIRQRVDIEHAAYPEDDWASFLHGFVRGVVAEAKRAEMQPANGYEELNRYRKATAIVNVLDAWGYTSEVLLTFTAQQWGMIARAAEVKLPSQLPIALCLMLLRDREAIRETKRGGAA